MAKFMSILAITFTFLAFFKCHADSNDSRKEYIVILDSSIESSEAVDIKILEKVLGEGVKPAESLVNVYTHATNGFSARLTTNEAKKLAGEKGVLSVFLSKNYYLEPPRVVGLPKKAFKISPVPAET